VRLTIGGEPTFIAADDMDGAEWNTWRSAPRKRELAGQALQARLRRVRQGGIVHYGQGKWYPGEPLPRWVLSCFWRKDGSPSGTIPSCSSPIRRSRDPLEGGRPASPPRSPGAWASPRSGSSRATRTRSTGVEGAAAARRVRSERGEPERPMERDRLGAMLEAGLGAPWATRCPSSATGRPWTSSPWHFVAGRMFLVPGIRRWACACRCPSSPGGFPARSGPTRTDGGPDRPLRRGAGRQHPRLPSAGRPRGGLPRAPGRVEATASSLGCPSCSRATCRRTTRPWTTSRSRPTRASSR
jgi:hypothetical protein